jgi:hypothetical protein
MKIFTLASVGYGLAFVLGLLSLLTMVFFGYQFYAHPTKPELPAMLAKMNQSLERIGRELKA